MHALEFFRLRNTVLRFRSLTMMAFCLGALFLCSCDDLDFTDRGLPTVVPPPPREGLGSATFNNTLQVTQLTCSASALYRFNGVAGVMGVLTIHTYPQPAGAANCALVVHIQRMANNAPIAAMPTFTRAVVPGESMSDVLDLEDVTSVEVRVECLGNGNACLFDVPELKCGVEDNGNPLKMPYAQVHSNPLAARNYTLKPGGNNCQTEEVELHKIYLDYPAQNVKINIVPVCMCLCDPYIVKAYYNRRTVKEAKAQPNRHGRAITIKDIDANQTMVRITGHCAGANNNTTCYGDALVYITRE